MENNKEIKNKTITGLFWRFGERITAQLISFVVSMVLARILMPEEYGLVSLVTIFITLANVFTTNGLGTALIQKKEADKLDFSTMFWAGIIVSFILYIILFICAPIIASAYNNQTLKLIIRIMGLKIPIAAINSIQQAYVSRKMIYKKFFFSTFFGTLVSAIVGIYMAVKNFGVWALVAQYLTNSCIDTIVLFITIDWRPTLQFSIERFKKMFSFGWKVMVTSFIGTFFDQLRGLLIGINYKSEDLAYYNKGEQIPALVGNNINSTMESVLFPAMSKVQDSKEDIKKATRRVMKTNTYIIMPMMFGLAAIASPLIRILLTDKWLKCVPFLQIVCMQQCVGIIGSANLQAIKAIGKSDVLLKLEIIKKPIYLIILIIAMQISPIAIAIGNLLYNIIAIVINAIPNKKFLGYSYIEQLEDVKWNFLLSVSMFLIVYIIGKCNLNIYINITLQILIGVVYYIFMSYILKNESLTYIKNSIKGIISNKKGEKNEDSKESIKMDL